ncbi:MAG TPA: terminase [Acidobacteriaceae bacterium]|nr:terminase [Acidobacteriaceae bacterium]
MDNEERWKAAALFSSRAAVAGGGDFERLLWLGKRLDLRSPELGSCNLATWLARALLRVRNRNGEIVPLVANAAQCKYEESRGNRNIVLKARQMGISTWVAGRFFLKTVTHPGTLTVQVAHNREAAQQIFTIVHRFYEHLPNGLKAGPLRATRMNAGQMYFPALDSEYRVESAADMNVGRGMTVQNLHCSEVSRWSGDAAKILASLRAALVPNGELVLESTPNGAHGVFYEEWLRAAESGTVPHFFPWWLEPAYVETAISHDSWTHEERALAEQHSLSAEQIGYRRKLQTSFRGMAAQEYAEDPEACFIASGNCIFDLAEITKRCHQVSAPMEKRENGRLWIWFPAVAGNEYLVSADPAGGGSDGDYAAVQVIEKKSGLQCAELCGHLDPRELAKRAAALAREYNDALLVVERNNHGMAVLAYLTMIERYPKLYEQRGQSGWLTTATSRPTMVEQIGAALSAGGGIFSSSRLLAECRTFVRQKDGRTGAAAGVHDDCLMAMAMALAVRTELA